MRTVCILIIMLICCPCQESEAQTADLITIATLRNTIQKYGPRNVVNQLNKGEGQDWLQIEAYISNGDAQWIALASELYSGTDASTSEGLILALAEALPKNPGAVLKLENTVISLKRICSLPFIEPEDAFIERYVVDTMTALDSVQDSALRRAAQTCRRRLQEVLKQWEERISAHPSSP